MELLWVKYRLIQMVISRSASACGYFLARHSRLVGVSQIFLGSVGTELRLPRISWDFPSITLGLPGLPQL